jgi:putative flippase GtrA
LRRRGEEPTSDVLSGVAMQLPRPFERLSGRLTQIWRDRALMLKAGSFALVGVVNFAVDFGVFSFAYYFLQWPIIAANVVSWSIAVSGSYVMNSLITFAAETGRQLRFREYATFVASQIGGLVANTATVFMLAYFMPVLLAKALAIGASFMVNFSLSHWFVFRRRDKATRH